METTTACVVISYVICLTVIICYKMRYSSGNKPISKKINLKDRLPEKDINKYDVCELIINIDGSLRLEYYNHDYD